MSFVIKRDNFKKLRWVMLTLIILFLCIIFVLPLGKLSSAYLENYFPHLNEVPKEAKGMILLGGSFDLNATATRGFTCYNSRGGRLIQFIELAHKYPKLPLIFTGGGIKPSKEAASESDIARQVFENLKLDLSRITFEDQSRNTFENAKFTFEMIQPKASEKWVLVTSALHMPRAVTLFRAHGWNVIPYPVDYHTSGKFTYWPCFSVYFYHWIEPWFDSFKEWVGLLLLRLKGVSQQLLPDKKI
jgi:uncharacterized SAM-binding protein YcdF (DUF218 family)